METKILTHADCDGICAGAIALSAFPNAEVFFTKPVSLLDDLSSCDAKKIIICDIAIDRRYESELIQLFESLNKKGTMLYYFDHHPIRRNTKASIMQSSIFIHKIGVSASELVYRYFKDNLPKERVWIAIYGAIGDYTDNTKSFRKELANWDKNSLYFEVSTIILGIKDKRFESYDGKREIVYALANGNIPSEVPELVESAKKAAKREFELYEEIKEKAVRDGVVGYVFDPEHFGFRSASALFSATVTNALIGICVHTRKNKLDLTIRSRDETITLNRLAEDVAISLGGSGGGHERAAGARIPKGTFDRFLEAVNAIFSDKKKRSRYLKH
ncbi:MAG TPA: DHH family phosphoesterase [Candidatus Aenigmarchaeota archaeon]|nr:MAG: phosphoesterase [Candidatus Aenigmarchaeota archaeon]HDD45924.1 DHH family phosphoesterase [Candidatus Aenigmarchaeota archaeon]